MIVILAVALIVVGPDKLPELARSLAKGLQELKKTVNQVKESLNEEGNVLNEVHGELQQTASELQNNLLEAEPHTWKTGEEDEEENNDEIIDLQPLEERPWEKDRKKEPESQPAEEASPVTSEHGSQTTSPEQADKQASSSTK